MMKRVIILGVVVLAVLLGSSSPEEEHLTVRGLTVTDASGVKRAKLGTNEIGDAFLEFYDATQKECLWVGVNPNVGASITLRNSEVSWPSVHLYTNSHYDRVGLQLSGKDPDSRVNLDVGHDTSALLRIYNAKGKGELFVGFDNEGNPSIRCVDSTGKVVFEQPK